MGACGFSNVEGEWFGCLVCSDIAVHSLDILGKGGM